MQRPLLIYEKVSYIFYYICRVKEMQVQMREIVLSLDAEGDILTAAAGHEVFHYLKENAANAAESLQKFILHRLLASEGFDLNAELAKYRDRYALETQGMTEKEQRIYLLEELTADSMFGVFSSKQAVELYARQQPKDAKKVAKAIRNFYEKVKKALETLSFKGMGTVSALQQQAETLEQISDLFFTALEEAQANRRQNKNTAEQGGAQVQKSKKIDALYSEYDVSNSDFIDRMSLKDYNNRGWAYSLLAAEDIRLFNERVSETMRKGSQVWTRKLKDGTKVLEINNKVLFVSGTFSNPVIEFVVAFNAENATELEILQDICLERLDYGNYTTARLASWFSIREAYYGKEYLVYYGRKDFVAASEQHKKEIQRATLPNGFASFGYAGTVRNRNGFSEQNEGEIPGLYEGQIKNSAKLSSDTADYITRLQQENADLQAALEAARAELHETRGLTISDAELRKISDFFADTLQSELTREDLFKALRGYFDYAADGGDLNVVLGTMTDLYRQAMQSSHSEMLWTELYDGQKEVLTDLRTNPVYLSEIQTATVTENYKNFQRASFGKIRFVKNHDGNHV